MIGAVSHSRSLSQHFLTVHVGQAEVENDQIGPAYRRPGACPCSAVAGILDAIIRPPTEMHGGNFRIGTSSSMRSTSGIGVIADDIAYESAEEVSSSSVTSGLKRGTGQRD